MARASSKTLSFAITSPTTGEARTLIERSYVKATRVGGGYIKASKQYALFDTKGRRYERISALVVVCTQTGERFHVVGEAESIRKTV